MKGKIFIQTDRQKCIIRSKQKHQGAPTSVLENESSRHTGLKKYCEQGLRSQGSTSPMLFHHDFLATWWNNVYIYFLLFYRGRTNPKLVVVQPPNNHPPTRFFRSFLFICYHDLSYSFQMNGQEMVTAVVVWPFNRTAPSKCIVSG
jgi:hypothetical protein